MYVYENKQIKTNSKRRLYLPFVAQARSVDLLRDALIHEWPKLLVILDIDQFLGSGGRIRYIQLRKKIREYILDFIINRSDLIGSK